MHHHQAIKYYRFFRSKTGLKKFIYKTVAQHLLIEMLRLFYAIYLTALGLAAAALLLGC